jgi:hypothetical protein
MRLAPAWKLFGILAAWLAVPAAASAASVWVTLAAGLPGSATPTSSTEFYFDNPHAPNIAVTELSGGVSAEATTAGGNTFFGGVGTPVLLNLGDGSAYIANGAAPPAAKTSGAGGGTSASTAPTAGGSVPSNAALLGIKLAEPNNGTRSLSASITDASGNPLGSGSVNVPDGGWWVIGLGPAAATPTPPTPPIDPTPPVDPIPDPPTTPTDGGGDSPTPANTPEPGTLAMAAIGSGAAYAWRRNRVRMA